MKKGLKIFIGSLTALMLLLLVGLAVLLNRLPSAGQLKKSIAQKEPATPQKPSTTLEKNSNQNSVQENNEPPINQADEQKATSKNTKDMKSIEPYIFDKDRELVDVCSHLSEAPHSVVSLDKGTDPFFNSVSEAIEAGKNDPFTEAVFAPIRFATRLPHAQEFFDAIKSAEENGEQNLMEKAGFYAKGLAAYQEIQSNNKKLNDIGNNAHHLFLISEAVRRNPQLESNPEVQSYCRELEAKMRSGQAYDFEKDPQEMLKFLEYAHLKPEDVKYDPKARSNMNVEFTRHSFSISFGWLGSYMDQPKKQ